MLRPKHPSCQLLRSLVAASACPLSILSGTIGGALSSGPCHTTLLSGHGGTCPACPEGCCGDSCREPCRKALSFHICHSERNEKPAVSFTRPGRNLSRPSREPWRTAQVKMGLQPLKQRQLRVIPDRRADAFYRPEVEESWLVLNLSSINVNNSNQVRSVFSQGVRKGSSGISSPPTRHSDRRTPPSCLSA